MLRNYIKIALRNLIRHKGFTLINLAGLTLGLSCCMIIFLYIQDELEYDRFHENADRTYRILKKWDTSDFGPQTPPVAAGFLKAEYPEIEHVSRIFKHWSEPLLAYEENAFVEERVFFADTSFFDVFSFEFLAGDPETALRDPGSIVLTQSMVDKYFGFENPIGRIMTYNTEHTFTVTAVLEDIPHNSHFHPDFLVSMEDTRQMMWPGILDMWGLNAFHTYVVLKERVPVEAFSEKLADFFQTYQGEESTATMSLQPLTDIHLRSQYDGELEANSDIQYIYLLGAIGILILLIACINYMNLTTARATGRAREVGLRKTVGAHRLQIVRQFFGESILLALLALLMSLVVVEATLPFIRDMVGNALTLEYTPAFVLGSLALVLIVGLMAGSYPALFLARYRPSDVLKGVFRTGREGLVLRKGLVILQFTASIVLIIGTVVVMQQLDYVKTARLGFEKEHVVIIPVMDENAGRNFDALSEEMGRSAGVLSVGGAGTFPGRDHASSNVTWEGAAEDEDVMMYMNWVNPGYIDAIGIEMVAGRGFSFDIATDAEEAVVVNESAVRAMGWQTPEEAVGKLFDSGADTREGLRIIGVMRDYHFKSMHAQIEPLVLYPDFSSPRHMLVRIEPGPVDQRLDQLKATWENFAATQPFTFSFLDAKFDALYRAEEQWSLVMGYASMIAILIACLGLFGLASYTTVQRTKEIGVRKVLGASAVGIFILLSKDYTRLVIISVLVAIPLGYLVMQRWLEDFAYHIEISGWIFLVAGLAALLIAWFTVSYQSVKAAISNPVDALRYE